MQMGGKWYSMQSTLPALAREAKANHDTRRSTAPCLHDALQCNAMQPPLWTAYLPTYLPTYLPAHNGTWINIHRYMRDPAQPAQ